MAMDVGGAKGGVKSDINVTPLVDVMLVLLIIMMLVAPLLQQGVDLVLPTAVNTVDKPDTGDATVVFVDQNNKFYVNALEVSRQDIPTRVAAVLEEKTERTVYLKGDKNALSAAEDTGKAFWGVFGALFLGMVAAIGGALVGSAKGGRRRPRPVVSARPEPRIEHREAYP